MANKIVDTLKSDAAEAAYRVAGTQITKGVKQGIIKAFQNKGGDSGQMEMLKALLDSEVGDALVALLLGYALEYAPGLKEQPKVVKLAEELRTQGMTTGGNIVVGAAMDTFLPVLTSALQNLPEETTHRISSEEQEEEEERAPAKIARR